MFEMSGLENDQVAVVRGKRGGSRMVGRGSLGTMRPQGERKEMPGADRALRTGLELMGGPRTLCWPQCTHGAAHTFHSLTHTQQRNSDSEPQLRHALSYPPGKCLWSTYSVPGSVDTGTCHLRRDTQRARLNLSQLSRGMPMVPKKPGLGI